METEIIYGEVMSGEVISAASQPECIDTIKEMLLALAKGVNMNATAITVIFIFLVVLSAYITFLHIRIAKLENKK